MRSIKSPSLICIKGLLFLVLGLLAFAMLVREVRSVTVTILLAISIWAFCRFYFFAFYVVQRHVDPTYRFAGLLSLAFHVARRRARPDFPGDKQRRTG